MSRDQAAFEFGEDDAPARSERERIEQEIDEEIRFHLEARARALEEAGLDARAAHRTALAYFGDRRRIRRACLVQRQWRPIMLQRLHLATTVLLLVAAAILGARSLLAEAAYESRLEELGEAVERLQASASASLAPGAIVAPGLPPKRVDLSTIAVGDVLEVRNEAHQDLHVVCSVCYDGMILLPQLGWFMAAGKTLPVIDAELNTAFYAYYTTAPKIVTMLKEAALIRVEPDSDRPIAPGDYLRLYDEAHPFDVNFTIMVDPDGTLLLDQLGRFHVAGYTRSDLETILVDRSRPFFTEEPVIRVTVTDAPRPK
ncbi:Polysaccharide biosynthesis/export protein [Planctomycetes bacterium Poly30]|uniref:Polysaccharide biosynthesis/export protein n=1 Tax=Saltatorellus ferox TaxID=2528018 RepID=A0A518ESD2_9BACT|nr:Polysaccharide biosynthesis/export protein [Planctomycetes bacterium Poly30]